MEYKILIVRIYQGDQGESLSTGPDKTGRGIEFKTLDITGTCMVDRLALVHTLNGDGAMEHEYWRRPPTSELFKPRKRKKEERAQIKTPIAYLFIRTYLILAYAYGLQ
ncbi:hypothetical protein ACTXT7_001118 [Hymenolepis weldensis]